MIEIIRPLEDSIENFTIFLAGPIQGAHDWHETAITYLSNYIYKPLCIAVPKTINKPKEWTYDKQVEWESKYLNKASQNGIILFWLPIEFNKFDNRSYAQTTRFELAEWVTKQKFNNSINIVIGIEPGFHGEKYMRKRISEENTNIVIYNNLIDLCGHIINQI